MTIVSDNLAMHSESELLRRHGRGDRTAFAELVRLFWPSVNNYYARCGIDEATREDLLQETFLKIYRALDNFESRGSLRSWVFTIAANTGRSHFRKRSNKPTAPLPNNLQSPISRPTAHQVAEARESARWLGDAVERLPEDQREVIVLSCIEQVPHVEISQILGIPLNTVKTKLRRARLGLAKELQRRRLRAEKEVTP